MGLALQGARRDFGDTVPESPVRVVSGLAVVLAAFIPVYRVLPGSIGGAWILAALGLMIGMVLVGLGSRPRWFAVWVFAGYAALGTGLTSSGVSGIASTVPVAVQIFILIGIGPFAVRGLVERNPRLVALTTAAFLLSQTVSAFAGVAQLFGVSVLGWVQVNQRSPGLAGHPNVLGVMSSIAVLVAVSALLGRRFRAPTKSVLRVVLLVNVAALITTGSLSAMLSCVVGVIVLFYVRGYRLIRIFLVAAATVFALWGLLSVPFVSAVLRNPVQRFYQVTGQTQDQSTLGIRTETYDAAWRSIQNEPLLGRGLDAENAAAREAGTVVHNIFLRSWYQGGILLAAAIAVILIAVLIATIRAVSGRDHGLAVSVMVVMLTFAQTSAFFEQPYYWLPVLLAWSTLSRAQAEVRWYPEAQLSTAPPGLSSRARRNRS